MCSSARLQFSAEAGAHLTGADEEEEAGGKCVKHHLGPRIDACQCYANAHAHRCRDSKGHQEHPRLPATPANTRPSSLKRFYRGPSTYREIVSGQSNGWLEQVSDFEIEDRQQERACVAKGTHHQLAPTLRQRADSAMLSTHLCDTNATSTVTIPTFVSCASGSQASQNMIRESFSSR